MTFVLRRSLFRHVSSHRLQPAGGQPREVRDISANLERSMRSCRAAVCALVPLAVLPPVPPEDPLLLLLVLLFQPYGLICITGVSLAAAEALRGSCFNVPALSGPAPSFPSQRGQGS